MPCPSIYGNYNKYIYWLRNAVYCLVLILCNKKTQIHIGIYAQLLLW